jgi:hypothetical protein
MAKKIFVLNNLLLALVLLNGDTSVWEGASAPDVYDSLPGRGFYVSTSFFPRNTVVDITSLETGKTIQVIVADNSSSPGNGVILSRDAADALGVGKRSSMRIRISPLSDTTAFSRFSDGRSFSGDPDYDPRAFIRANTLPVETQALSASPYGNIQIAQEAPYAPPAGSPPPVSIIPDQAESGTTVADASRFELPNTVLPFTTPSEPVTIFMPAPVPTAVMVDSPPDVTAPNTTDAPKDEVYTTAAEVPEVYEMPLTPGTDNRTGRPYYSESAVDALANEPEPETSFPDVIIPSGNPIDYQGEPYLALNEAVIDESVITKPADTTVVMTESHDTETTPEQAENPGADDSPAETDMPETAYTEYAPGESVPGDLYEAPFREDAAEASLAYAEPDAETLIVLSEGGQAAADLEAEVAYSEGQSDESGPDDLYEAPFREEAAEASLAYAEPDADDLVALSEGGQAAADLEAEVAYSEGQSNESGPDDLYEASFREEAAEASLAYAEPDGDDLIALADEGWIIADDETETAYPEGPPDEPGPGDLYEAPFSEEVAEASLAYAEPDAEFLIALADEEWTIVDDETETAYPEDSPDESVPGDLYDALFSEESAETSLAYAEPDAESLIALADGPMILRDKENADELYLLPPLDETVALLREPDFVQQGDLYDTLLGGYAAEITAARDGPYSPDTVSLADGSLILEDRTIADILRLLSFPQETADDIPPEYQASLQEIYDAIARLELDGEAPQMVDLGSVGEEHTEMFPSPKDRAAAERGGRKAYLMLIKNLASGKYYLQIGVFNQKEALVRRLASLNWVYPYALETSGTLRSPMYKLLVGPVNEGESNALLLRFRREGFSGAFIRREG